ncbi:MAG TPA: tetratricopeptide repeat protein [Anaerolineales bacterium]
MRPSPPTGTVTFLFTDIENSSIIAQRLPEDWESLRERHNTILRAAIEGNNGYVFNVPGDAFCAAFHTVRDGLKAALRAQRELLAEDWGEAPVHVRMGIHTGEAQAQAGDYKGYLTLTRAQRVMSAAYGDQILLSNPSAELLRQQLPNDVSLQDMGEHRFKSLLNLERIWQAITPDLPQQFPPLSSLNAIPSNLPPQLTSFVGREKEIADVRELLQTRRLVSLTGSGGTGKTRLALQVAVEVMDSFRDGVWFVELAPLSEPRLVPSTVASTLGIREEQGRPVMATLLNWLRGRRILLVLDNCEHLIQACAELADAALRADSELHILASGREALGIAGECAYQVPSLESPDPAQISHIPIRELAHFPAVRLFVERARESLATFELDDSNVLDIIKICRRLDGIPLAIELAAARVKVLNVGQIAQRLDDRFQLLSGGSRTALPRHQTLRSLIDWSYSLLSEPEKALFRRLAVFVGGWTLEAAEEVCPGNGIESFQILDLLARLVDKSLIAADAAHGEARYGMLETVREYAQERLSECEEVDAAHNRHLQYILSLAERAGAALERRDEIVWLRRLDLDQDNLRLALSWALGLRDPEVALRLAGAAEWFWWSRGITREAEEWLRAALSMPGAEVATKGRAKALTNMGWYLCLAGEMSAGLGFLRESVATSRAIQEEQALAEALTWFGFMNSMRSDPASEWAALEEGLALARKLGYRPGAGRALIGIGQVKLAQGDYVAAAEAFAEGASLLRETGDGNSLAFAVRRLGHLALRQGDFKKAFALYSESLTINAGIGDKQGVANCLAAMASLAWKLGKSTRAAHLYGATAAVLESFNGQLIPADQAENDPYLSQTLAALGNDAYQRAYSDGHAMDLETSIAFALKLDGN